MKGVAYMMAVVFIISTGIFSGCAPMTCCPVGPPYNPDCSESFYYYFHGNQLQAAPAVVTMLNEAPWRHMGIVRVGGGAGTGVLIHPNFVLTAAHVVMDGGAFPEVVYFDLAKPCQGCLPYGTKSANRIWVPQEWIENIGGDYDSMETRAYDWALLEIDLLESAFHEEAPDPIAMPISNQLYSSFDHLTPRAAGYPCGQRADGQNRRRSQPYATDDSASFIGQTPFPVSGGAEGGAVIRASLEAAAGMSGGPVWVEINGLAQLIGVIIGSTQEACNAGENWVAALSTNTRARIDAVIANGSAPGMVSQGFQVGGGGFDECPNLLNAVNGPCQLPIGSSGEASGCDNIEDPDE